MNVKSKSTLNKFRLELSFKNYSENSIRTYLNYTERFLMSFDCDVYHITQRMAIDHLKNKIYSSISQQNQYICK